ncbi:MAG TPA: cytochrome c oxidase subunit 3 [Methylophilaceae bacterium]|nr:cytochrome c oxidase subunit 3 [Methylophilaceae bacterium]
MSQNQGKYYIAPPSHWPIIGSCALFLMASGFIMLINELGGGGYILLAGVAVLAFMLFGWFGSVIRESEGELLNQQVGKSFRLAMSWFIFSEVMFFAIFFGALFYARVLSVPWLSEGDTMNMLWPNYGGGWPTSGPGGKPFETIGAWGIPAINTLILLSSGVTLTWAHWGLLKNKRSQLILGLFLTVALGITFIALQALEYHHAYTELGLTLGAGIYGATFFMLTGFHGFHVTLGTLMLIVILMRSIKGHFTPENHFGFEGVAWYWHFVDVVWLLLFIFVYAL